MEVVEDAFIAHFGQLENCRVPDTDILVVFHLPQSVNDFRGFFFPGDKVKKSLKPDFRVSVGGAFDKAGYIILTDEFFDIGSE